MAGYNSAQGPHEGDREQAGLDNPGRVWRRDRVARQGKKPRTRPARQRSAKSLANRK